MNWEVNGKDAMPILTFKFVHKIKNENHENTEDDTSSLD
jgi:hypothetical protein